MKFFKTPQSSKDTELDLTQLNHQEKHFFKHIPNKRKRKREIYRTRLFIGIALLIDGLSLKIIQTFTTDTSFFLISFLAFSFIGSITGFLFGYYQLRFFQSSKYLLLFSFLFTLLQHSIDSTTIATIYLLSFLIMFISGKLCYLLLRQAKQNNLVQSKEVEIVS